MKSTLKARHRVALPLIAGFAIVSVPAASQQQRFYGTTAYGSGVVSAYNPYTQSAPSQAAGRPYGPPPGAAYPQATGPIARHAPPPPAVAGRLPTTYPQPQAGQIAAYNPWRAQQGSGYAPPPGVGGPTTAYMPSGGYAAAPGPGANLPNPPSGPIRSRLLSVPEIGNPQGATPPFHSVPYAPRPTAAARTRPTQQPPQLASGGTGGPAFPPTTATRPRSKGVVKPTLTAAAQPPKPPAPQVTRAAPAKSASPAVPPVVVAKPPEPPKPVAASPAKSGSPAVPPVVAAKPPEPPKAVAASPVKSGSPAIPPIVAAKPPEPPKPVAASPVKSGSPAVPPVVAAKPPEPPKPVAASPVKSASPPVPPVVAARPPEPPKSASPAIPPVAAAKPVEPPKPAPVVAAEPPKAAAPSPPVVATAPEPPKPVAPAPTAAVRPPEPALIPGAKAAEPPRPAPVVTAAPPPKPAAPPEPPKPAPPAVAAVVPAPPKPDTPPTTPSPAPTPAKQPVVASSTRVTFETNSPALSPDARQQLDRLAADLVAHPTRKLTLKAYSNAATGQETRRLALARGLAVRAYLIDKGVPRDRLDVQALGTSADGGPTDRVDAVVSAGT